MAVYTNMIGLTLKFDTKIDLTTATELKILYLRPDGVKGEWNAQKVANEVTKLGYVTKSKDDINVDGTWIFQPYVKGENFEYYGNIVNIYFHKHL